MRAEVEVMWPRLAVLVLVVLVSGCASQPPPSPLAPGFLAGLGHGLVAPIAFLVSLLNPDVRVYAFPNAGVGYDFGFLVGLIMWGGGVASSGRGGGDPEDEVSRLRAKVRRLRRRLRGTAGGAHGPTT